MPHPRTEGPTAHLWTGPVGLLALTCLLAIAVCVAGQSGEGLELGEVTYNATDSDGDGLDDSVQVNATLHNRNETRSWTYLVAAYLVSGEDQVDLETRSGLLASMGSGSATLLLTVPTSTQAGTFTVRVDLHVQDLQGEVVDTTTSTIALSPLGDYSVALGTNRTSAEVMENTTVAFTLNVTSTSNNPTEVTVNVTSPGGWTVVLESDRVLLEPGANVLVGLEVLVPHNEPPGTREILSVQARAVRDPSAIDGETLTLTVARQVFELDLELSREQVMLVSGQTVPVPGTVTNLGNNQDSVSLEVTAPPEWTWEFVPPDLHLDRGATGAFVLHLTASASLTGSGTLQVDVTAISESLTSEDTHSLAVAYNMGDLAVDTANVSYIPKAPVAGDEVTLQAQVRNLGPIELVDIDVAIVVEGVEFARTTLASVPVGGMTVATLVWTPGSGSHLVRVSVDPDDVLSELDRENNVASLTITVLSPNLAVHQNDIVVVPDYPTEGAEVNITVTVHNVGGALAGPFDVDILVDGVVLVTLTVDSGLAPGANATVDHAWTTAPGRHTVEAVVDPEGAVLDPDPSNDQAERGLSVNTRPVAAVTLSATVVEAGSPVGLNASASSDPDGRVRQYFFDYGDGSDSGWTFSPLVEHSYEKGSEYEVRVYVKDEAGAQSMEPAVATVKVRGGGTDGGDGEGSDLVLLALVVAIAVIALLAIANLVPRLRGSR